jgi:hypothetical protein
MSCRGHRIARKALRNDVTEAMSPVLQRSRRVASSADALQVALASSRQEQIEDAVSDLATTFDRYAQQAEIYGQRYGFDEVASVADPSLRDQISTSALASALIDLNLSAVLGEAARSVAQPNTADLNTAVATLRETLAALEAADTSDTGGVRYGFDELPAAAAPAPAASPDKATAAAGFERQIVVLYDALLAETTALLKVAFEQSTQLDADEVRQALDAATGSIGAISGGKLVVRSIEAVKRALDTLKNLIGSQNLDDITERVEKTLEEIRKGEGALQIFLKYSYGYEPGQQQLAGLIQTSAADAARLDAGVATLVALEQQILQMFVIERRLVAALRRLRQPLDFLLKRFGGTLPLDLLIGGGQLLMIDIALLRGMDYADTTQVVTLVDGIIKTTKRVLGRE